MAGDVIRVRRSTAAQWTSANPVLSDGEPGLERDTRRFKFGDGVTVWNSLPYAGGGTGGTVGTDVPLVRRCVAGTWPPLGAVPAETTVFWLKTATTDPDPPEARLATDVVLDFA